MNDTQYNELKFKCFLKILPRNLIFEQTPVNRLLMAVIILSTMRQQQLSERFHLVGLTKEWISSASMHVSFNCQRQNETLKANDLLSTQLLENYCDRIQDVTIKCFMRKLFLQRFLVCEWRKHLTVGFIEVKESKLKLCLFITKNKYDRDLSVLCFREKCSANEDATIRLTLHRSNNNSCGSKLHLVKWIKL